MPPKTPKSKQRTAGARKSTAAKATKAVKKPAPSVRVAKKATKAVPKKAAKATKIAPKKAAKAPAKKATKAVSKPAKVTRPAAKATKVAPKKLPTPAKAAEKKKEPVKAAAKAAPKPNSATRTEKMTVPAKTAPAPAKPAAPKPPVRPPKPEPKRLEVGYTDEKFLAHQKAALERERATYVEQASSLQAEADLLIAEMEPGDIQFDEESGEGGTVAVDRERDLALSAQALEAVEEIDAALQKIVGGRYGICENCGQLIAKARLEALPYARLCIACKSGGLSRR